MTFSLLKEEVMNEEQKYPSEEAMNLDAGKDKFERSEI
jgi:hypothetical protein